MRLAHVEIRDYRSIFVDDSRAPLRLDLAEGVTTLVGMNNCGKSNVLRAIALAMDPNISYDTETDPPGPRPFAHPIIALMFEGSWSDPVDATALSLAQAYEERRGISAGDTLATQGQIGLYVKFVPTEAGAERVELLLTARGTLPLDTTAQNELAAALAGLRDAVRFVLISSGESIESVLEGNFREILHSVVRERLKAEFADAEQARGAYIDGISEKLLKPLQDRLKDDVGDLFPEIEGIALAPAVSSIESTLSNVEVHLDDLVSTPLAGKGTGVRGGVLVAMLSYLATNATRGMVFAVEEPEAFLHPAGQEALRDHLETIASASGVTLLVTTHSPFVVTRSANGQVYSLAKDRTGCTRIAESASGDADHAPLVGGLLREATMEDVLALSHAIPPGTAAVVLVEGDGDRLCLELVARVLRREDLLAGLHITPTGGTMKMIAKAVVTRAAAGDVPVIALVDNDDPGRSARKSLIGGHFGFAKKHVLTYAQAFDGPGWAEFAVEAEDLFAPDLIQRFVDAHGPMLIDGSKKRPDEHFHYDLGQAAKGDLKAWLEANTTPDHVRPWLRMIRLIRSAAGLPDVEDSDDEIIERAAVAVPAKDPHEAGDVLVVKGADLHSRYLSSGAIILDAGTPFPDGVTHIGFYNRGIQPEVPRIVAEHSSLVLSTATVEQLRSTTRPADERVAVVVEEILATTPGLAGETRRVLLLTPASDPATIELAGVVRNTSTMHGRPVAWLVQPRTVPLAALSDSPATTDDLDAAIAEITSGEDIR